MLAELIIVTSECIGLHNIFFRP